jgi:outer membrane protein OmpA-like peptidoglycan-associated protein
VVKLNSSAFFLPDSTAFAASTDSVLTDLQPIIRAWRTGKYSHIEVVGHCAKFGPPAGALLLSRQRAARVAALLRIHGVTTVTSEGVGYDQLLTPDPQNAANRVVIVTAYPRN